MGWYSGLFHQRSRGALKCLLWMKMFFGHLLAFLSLQRCCRDGCWMLTFNMCFLAQEHGCVSECNTTTYWLRYLSLHSASRDKVGQNGIAAPSVTQLIKSDRQFNTKYYQARVACMAPGCTLSLCLHATDANKVAFVALVHYF